MLFEIKSLEGEKTFQRFLDRSDSNLIIAWPTTPLKIEISV